MFISIERHRLESIQEQIFEQVRSQILAGSLRPGAKVASTRALAVQLRVSRNSVTFAYERLINEGYLVTKPTAGTFVAPLFPEQAVRAAGLTGIHPSDEPQAQNADIDQSPAFTGRRHSILNTSRNPIDFWTQRTDPGAFPLRSWRRVILQSLASAGRNLTEYGDPCGYMPLRSAIAEHVLDSRGIHARPEQIIILAGAQLALNLALRVLIRGHELIAVENPCNQGAAYLFESLGMTVLPLRVDARGIDAESLVKSDARLVYLTPSHQFPMGPTLSLSRRKTIVEWAQRTGAYILEDDYDSEFRYDDSPFPALKALAPARVIYLGTFSKSLGAGLRIGFAIFPEALGEAAGTAKALLDNGHVWLEQAALARFISGGGFARHVRRIRQSWKSRRDALLEGLRSRLGKLELMGTEAGTHVAMRVPEGPWKAHDIKNIARITNVGVYTVQSGGGHEYGAMTFNAEWLLLGYASLSEHQIGIGVERLSYAIDRLKQGELELRKQRP
jgi:GntR family transcriptional regulator / MocR family aminotransferase